MASRSRSGLRAFRIADRRHPLFDGGGAAAFGGRWNSPGHRVIYASLSFAGALLERLALAGIGMIPKNQDYLVIELAGGVEIEEVGASEVPGWSLADQTAARTFGDRWIEERRTAALVVPSLVAQSYERNLVINQGHAEFSRIRTGESGAVTWDSRVLQAIRSD